ncbi:sensor histidine kinase [Aquabacterium humicola]|uniref:sensor histidine kinase n=1 Tax=Aquabacterium humicola TaxID=3237377 RepID=UPI002543A897|nr:sensor histidine kinase [Rubrivivax pictus]
MHAAPAPPTAPGTLPRWLRSRYVPWTVAVLALLLLAAAASFVAYQRRGFERAALERAELYARVVEDHANRTFDATELTLQALAQAIDGGAGASTDTHGAAVPVDVARVTGLLADALRGQPFLRSLSLVDAQGRVLASSQPENLGHTLPLRDWTPPGGHPPALGPLQRGRDWSSLRVTGAASPGLLPMLRPLSTPGRWLVAALNTGYFENQHALIIGQEPFAAALLGFDGQLIAATDLIHAEPGSLLGQHRVFQDFLPAREAGRFEGPGLDGEPAYSAFRSMRRHPMLLLVETPRRHVDEQVAEAARVAAAISVTMFGVITALGLLAWRSLRGHETARVDLAHARGAAAAQHAFTDRLFEVSPVPTVVRGIDGRYQRVNRAWCAFTGLVADRVIGRRLEEVVPVERAERYAVREREALASGQLVVYEAVVPDRHGQPRDVMIRIAPFTDPAGAVAGVITSVLDVTEFREAERQVREAKEAAERANDAKSEFLANISHELRTPLQTILGFAELGLRRSGSQPMLQRMFEDIVQGGKRMLHLVNTLLDLSRLDSTVGAIRLQRIDIEPALREVVQELAPMARERGLRFAVPAPVHLLVDADAFRLQQVLRNVLANGLRFAPTGTAIELDWQSPAGGGALIQVRDRGPGIPPDELETIFEPFVQSSRTKDGSGGTGLGLAICRKVLAAHRGSIRARNADGGGAVFEIRLPPPGPDVTLS